MDIKQLNECPDCASSNVVHSQERDQLICRDCGLIYEPLTPAAQSEFAKTHNITAEKPSRKPAKKKVKKKK
ncbi:hypothetical protein HY489_03190 [Candidatus Woesearchaeota archaeon]|nr:hypothetical protein [Candidatus Woesearchaeota archaeon]